MITELFLLQRKREKIEETLCREGYNYARVVKFGKHATLRW
jgi:hypothetical protein